MEGFGMPQLEALICGCPIVTSHNTAMIEVARGKDGATTVQGYEVKDWQEAIMQTLESHPQVRQEQLSEYDWQSIIAGLRKYIKQKLS